MGENEKKRCKHGLPKGQCALCLTKESAAALTSYGGQSAAANRRRQEAKADKGRGGTKDIDNQPRKECHACGEEKVLDEFPKHEGCKDGHENTCKACRAKQAKDRYKNRNKKAKETIKPEPIPPVAKVKTEPESKENPSAGLGSTKGLFIDTTLYPDLIDNLEQSAVVHIRTVEHQALAYIVRGLKEDGAGTFDKRSVPGA